MKRPTNAQYVAAARARFIGAEGDVEVDQNAKVSLGDDPGAYVQAWVWVPNEEAVKFPPQKKGAA